MKEIIEKIKNNKILNIIWNIVYTILFILVVLMLLVVIIQRTSNNNIALGGYRMFNVATESMIPKYEVGDILIAKEISPEELKIGDDVAYIGKEGSFNDRIVTHQIIEKNKEDNKYIFLTKGIANDIADPKIGEEQILGKIIYKAKLLSLFGKAIQNIYVFYFIIFIPIVLIIFKQIYRILKDREDNIEEDIEDSNDIDK